MMDVIDDRDDFDDSNNHPHDVYQSSDLVSSESV